MKIKFLNYILCGIITLNLASCGNKTDSKSENVTELQSDGINLTPSDFIYSNGDKKVEILLENEAEFLVVGKPTKVKFKTENINDQRLAIFGAGLRMNSASDKEFRFVITPINEYLKDGKLEIKIVEKMESGENFTHTFLLPVKTKVE